MKRLSGAFATVVAVAALGAVAPVAAGQGLASEVAAAAVAKRCAKVDIGYTLAAVRARNVACPKARRFLYRWAREKRTGCDESNDFCKVTHRAGFRCVRGGSTYVVTLYCRRGEQRIKGTWGD